MTSASFAPARAAARFWQLSVFDLDGTLVDTQDDLLDSLAEAIGPEEFDSAARSRARGALHLGMQAMAFAALGEGPREPKRMRAVEARYFEIYAARIARLSRVYTGVTTALH